METRLLLVVTAVIIPATFNSWAESTRFTIQNNCPHPIWPAAVVTSAHSPPLGNTGFALGPGLSETIDAPLGWMGLFWARTLCSTNSSGGFSCAVGDCGTGQVPCNGKGGAPPATVVEFTLDGYADNDFYDVGVVKGFNLPLTIAPQTSGCRSTGCVGDVNGACPSDLAVRKSDGRGEVIGCKSACVAFDTDAYCCRGEFSSTQTCSASNYSRYFKFQCPQAATYRDDSTSITCPSGGDYVITFCPSTQPKFIGMLCEL